MRDDETGPKGPGHEAASQPSTATLNQAADIGTSDALVPMRAMDSVEAHDITRRIKASAEATWNLLFEAHERMAWRVLGYRSWSDYVRTEFGMSRGRSYQLLDQALVIREIGSVSTSVDIAPVITEAAARDLKPVLPEVLTEAKRLIAGLEAPQPGDAGRIVRDVVRAKRAEARAPNRRPLTEVMNAAMLDLERVCRRFRAIAADDRFKSNEAAIRERHHGRLTALADELDDLDNLLYGMRAVGIYKLDDEDDE